MAARDDDDAPWLAEATPPAQTRVSRRSLFWTVLTFLVLAAIVVAGTVMLMSRKDAGSTQGYMNAEQAPLIEAEAGPYKVKPADPKGLAVEGQDQTLYAAGAGIDQGSVIDESARPEDLLPRPGTVGPPTDLLPAGDAGAPPPAVEAPAAIAPAPVVRPAPPPPVVTRPEAPPASRPAAPPASRSAAPRPAAAPVAPPPPVVTPAPARRPEAGAAAAGTVQLGAFSTAAKADSAWSQLAARHGMAGFTKRVTETTRDGQTLWRLRGAGGDAAQLCAKLKAAGDPCAVVE